MSCVASEIYTILLDKKIVENVIVHQKYQLRIKESKNFLGNLVSQFTFRVTKLKRR